MSVYKSNSKPELLAPAGNLKKLKYALQFGADAVYMGLPAFSLRAKTGFDMKTLGEGIEYAHSLKKKAYVTINIFAHNRHLKILPQHLQQLKKMKPDAVIISDPGVLEMVKKQMPKTELHLSTQMNTLNSGAVKFWYKQGIRRIILARETTLQDIKEIHRAVPKMELEVFVHGAMCMSYSGRCYLSAWMNKRSANEGLCTQPCRWDYNLYIEEPKRPGEMIPIEGGKTGTFIMNSKDLMLLDYLDDLKKAGVVSFKLEGRTKSIYYLAVIVRMYRQAMDKKLSKKELTELKKDLDKVENREYTTGFIIGEDKNINNFKTSKAKSDWEFVGEVTKVTPASVSLRGAQRSEATKQFCVFIAVHNTLLANKQIEIVTPNKIYKTKIRLYNSKGEEIKEAHGGTKEIYHFELKGDYDIVEMSVLRQKIK